MYRWNSSKGHACAGCGQRLAGACHAGGGPVVRVSWLQHVFVGSGMGAVLVFHVFLGFSFAFFCSLVPP